VRTLSIPRRSFTYKAPASCEVFFTLRRRSRFAWGARVVAHLPVCGHVSTRKICAIADHSTLVVRDACLEKSGSASRGRHGKGDRHAPEMHIAVRMSTVG